MKRKLRTLSCFTGAELHGLGLVLTGGFQIVGQIENDPYCQAVLHQQWPDVPKGSDIRKVRGETIKRVCGHIDMITGGFPCQNLSIANRNAEGLDGAKSGLFFEMLRLIQDIRPRFLLIENVPALANRGADRVFSALEEEGYWLFPFVFGAWSVGAPHKRDRMWIIGFLPRYLANARSSGRSEIAGSAHCDEDSNGRRKKSNYELDSVSQTSSGVANSDSTRKGIGTGKNGRTKSVYGSDKLDNSSCKGFQNDSERIGDAQEDSGYSQPSLLERIAAMAYPTLKRLARRWVRSGLKSPTASAYPWPAPPGPYQYSWEYPRLIYPPTKSEAEQPLGVAINGRARWISRLRREELKALGNANPVPVARLAGETILFLDAIVRKIGL